MNVSLQDARSKSRLNWDDIEARNERAQALPRRVFFAVLLGFFVYLGWNYFAA